MPNTSIPKPVANAAAAIAALGAGGPSSASGGASPQRSARRHEQQTPRADPEHRQAAEDQPGRLAGEDRPPGAGAAEMRLRLHRPEHLEDAAERRVHERELHDDRPEPRPRPECLPALAQLAQEARRLRPPARRQAHRRREDGPRPEGRGVDRDRPAGAGGGDDRAAERSADHVARVDHEPEERVRLLDHRRRHGLRDDPGRGGEEERGGGAVDGADCEQVPEPRVAGQQEGGEQALARAAEDAGGDHHLVARQPVGQDPADEQEHDLGRRAGGEDEAEVGRRAGQPENGEREGDRSHRVPEERDGAARVEQTVLALGERPEPARETAQPCSDSRRLSQ